MRRTSLSLLCLLLVATVLTGVASPASAAITGNDAFTDGSLDDVLWDEAGNSFGGATFQYPGGIAALSVPGGASNYQPWTQGNRAPTLRQTATNTDFDVATAFVTIPSQRYQLQGIVVGDNTTSRFLRVDVHYDGTAMRVFAADPLASTSALLDVQVPSDAHARFLRVRRVGNTFTVYTADSNGAWVEQGSFTHSMTVTEIGPFIGNASPGGGDPAPAYSGGIDYFGTLGAGATGSLLDDEIPASALGTGDDVADPDASAATVVPGPDSVSVSWSGLEPVTATAQIGGTTIPHAGAYPAHQFSFTGLSPATNYTVVLTLTDLNGNTDSHSFPITTLGGGTGDGPDIEVWHGSGDEFGTRGTSQRWVNIIGTLSDPDGVAALQYSVNGGPTLNAGLAGDAALGDRRLTAPGDFNIDLLRSSLNQGTNTVVLTAFDTPGNTTVRSYSFELVSIAQPMTVLGLDWSDYDTVSSAADVVDGEWSLVAGGGMSVQAGYDRIVALGDTRWADYDVFTSVVVDSIAPDADNAPSFGTGVGVALRWNGHNNTVTPGTQPQQGYLPESGSPTPFGALAMWRDVPAAAPDIRIFDHRAVVQDSIPSTALTLGQTYLIRAQVVGNTYRFKFWRSGTSEPSTWVEFVAGTNDLQPATGAIALVAHEVKATFGDLYVRPWGASAAPNPTLSPAGGVIDEGSSIVVTTTGGGVAYYTTDGSTPQPWSDQATFGVPVSTGTTVKVVQYVDGMRPSSVVTASYTVNKAPVVSAGPDASATLGTPLALSGSATDDGVGGALTTEWRQVSGPGTATFSSNSANATVAFDQPGTYELSFEASDTRILRSDSLIVTVTGGGYWLANAAGRVAQFGTAQHFGDLSGTSLAAPVSAIASNKLKTGYWLVQENGATTPFGSVPDVGGLDDINIVPVSPVVDAAATATGQGVYLLGADGGIFSFGDAEFFGSTGGIALDLPIVSMANHATGRGYWFVAKDGGIFSFGPDAPFHGSVPQVVPYSQLDADIVAMAVTPSGNGYWLVAADGGIFAFGDAEFFGSIPGVLGPGGKLDQPIVGMVATPSGKGYWLVAADGGVFSFGDAGFFGSDPSLGQVVGLG